MAGGKQFRQNYVPYFEPAKKDPNYPNGQQRILVDSVDSFQKAANEIINLKYSCASLDTETTGLSPEHEDLVGVSLAISKTKSFYFPVAHKVGDNLPIKPVLELIAEVNKKVERLFFYNPIFDIRFLKRVGIEIYLKIENIKYFDVQALVFNTDTNLSMPRLKWAMNFYLGWSPKTFEETVGDKIDFSYNNPKECYEYPCDDALGTINLPFKLSSIFKECEFVCNLDNHVSLVRMHMEDNPTQIDTKHLEKMLLEVDESMAEAESKVYRFVGYNFKINSSQQLVRALDKLGLKTLKKTAGGKSGIQQSSTKEDALEEIKNQHPVIEHIIDYKKLLKMKSSYVQSLLENYREDLKGCRFAYFSYAVPSGRFASGGEKSRKENKYFAKINVQSIPKPKKCFYTVAKAEDKDPESILGYKFTESEVKSGSECYVSKNNVRKAFVAPEGYYWVSIDYSQEEVRLPANFSKEPVWVDAFLNNLDIHKETSLKVLGGYDSELRRIAKELNFGALYGGSPWTFSSKIGCSLEKAEEAFNKWWSVLRVLKRWAKGVEAFAQKNGFVKTYFGRIRRLKFWYMSSSWKVRKFADRSAVNHVVQGTAADIIRYVMVLIYKRLRKFFISNDLQIKSTIHDEINFIVRKLLFHQIVPKIVDIMEIKIKEWVVPMKVEVSVGDSWGRMFKFEFKDNQWVPVVEEQN